MVSGCPRRPVWRWLVIVALVVWGTGAALAPTRAQPPCLETEDGRCLPAPVPANQGPRLDAHARPDDRSPGSTADPAALVRRRDAVSPARFAATLQEDSGAPARGLGLRGWWRVGPAPGETMEDLLARLRAKPEVVWAEEDTPVEAAYLPNDPDLTYQWALPRVGADAAWDHTMGHEDVWIAIVDTGVDDTHPDRPAQLWRGWDFANDDADPSDDHGHGTHVAGIAAAATDNARGVAGLCPGCGVLAIKVLGADGRGWNSDVAEGIVYAAEWGADAGRRTIINVSLGGGESLAVAEAVERARSRGALVVAAAGNDGPMAPDYPAALDGVLAVAASDADDRPAEFSQYGDIAAPGVHILSTVSTGTAGNPAWPYEFWSGTSMACPMVAGAAGLVWSLAPSLSAPAVSDSLLAGVDVPAGWNPAYGAGRLNVARSLSAEPTPTATFTPIPSPTPTATPEPAPSLTPAAPATIPAPTATAMVALPEAPKAKGYSLALPLLALGR